MRSYHVILAVSLIGSPGTCAVDPSAEVARSISKLRLDATECYRFANVDLQKGPLSLHLGAGWIIFAEPVRGVRPGAVYISSSGENRIVLAPTVSSERLALDRAVHKKALNEPFGKSLMLFTDGTDQAMRAELDRQHAPKDPGKGADLAQEWTSIFAHIADAFHTRLVRDLIAGDRGRGVFYAGVATATVGDIDIFYDPSATEEAVIGKLNSGHFDIMATCCEAKAHVPMATIGNYYIDATIHPDLQVSVVTKATVKVMGGSTQTLVFSISRLMNVLHAEVDGVPAPVFQSQSQHSNLLRDQGTGEFFIVAPVELKPGSVHEVRIEHEGELIKRFSNGELLVWARESWYPRIGNSPAQYELRFHSSPELTLVASGEQVAEYLEGESRVSQWKTLRPVIYATFNAGRFDHLTTKLNDFGVDIYFPDSQSGDANLGPAATDLIVPASSTYSLGAQRIANQALEMMSFMTARLGPVPANTLSISPSPSPFGQNLSGHVVLPSSFYKDFSKNDKDLETSPFEQRLRTETGVAHEVAHQWWGNAVRFATYHDEWITESLANYSAVLHAEQMKGKAITQEVLDHYRKALDRKTPQGQTVLDAGPVTWGYRLLELQGGSAWRPLTYGKGTLIIHGLRTMMGDAVFDEFLRTLFTNYQANPISTPELERLAARDVSDSKAKAFFDSYVYGTSMP